MRIELVVFDLDGTLIDSKLDLALAVNATRAEAQLLALEHETVFSYVGDGAPTLIRRALGEEAGEEQLQHSLEFFLVYYRLHMLDNTRLYPGVREALDHMLAAGLRLAVLTNKPVRFSRDLIRGLGLAGHFQAVYGGNSFDTKKPDPEGLRKVIAEMGVAPEETLVVGDSGVDVQTARNAGAWACGVTYGFQPETFRETPPDLLVDDLEQLAESLIQGRVKQPSPAPPARISGPNCAAPFPPE